MWRGVGPGIFMTQKCQETEEGFNCQKWGEDIRIGAIIVIINFIVSKAGKF
jgi:hypothetical protein